MTHPAPAAGAHPRHRGLALAAAAALAALVLVFFMISSVTSAAWTATTSNNGNSWATGTVSLTDDRAGTAVFSTADALMVPGSVISKTITVTNGSDVPLNVRLYGSALDDLDLLAQHLTVTIGTSAGASDVYSGTLLAFADKASYATGTPAVEFAAGASTTYYIAVTLAASAPDSAQGDTAGISFVWEGQTL